MIYEAVVTKGAFSEVIKMTIGPDSLQKYNVRIYELIIQPGKLERTMEEKFSRSAIRSARRPTVDLLKVKRTVGTCSKMSPA